MSEDNQADRKVYPFKDSAALDQLLSRVLLEHPKEFADRSDLLRKAVHFCLKSMGYSWPEQAGKPEDTGVQQIEEEISLDNVFAVDAGERVVRAGERDGS